MTRRAVLHIGTFKTGSTSIQAFLDRNTSLLENQGVCFPKSLGRPNHHGLAIFALDESRTTGLIRYHKLEDRQKREARRVEIANALSAELAALPGEIATVVFSNEHLSGLYAEEEIRRLQELLAPHFDDIRIVAYLRRQDQRIISDYTEKVRDGYTTAFDIMNYRPAEGLDYRAFLDRWANVFGKRAVAPRIFSRRVFVNGDLIDDFLAAIGGAADPAFVRPAVENFGLSHEAIEFLRVFNQYAPAYADGKANPVRTHLLPFLAKGFPGEGVRPDRAAAKALLDFVATSNADLGAAYFGGGDPFPDDLSDYRDEPPATPTFEDAAKIAAFLWTQHSQSLNRLTALRLFVLLSSDEARKFAEKLLASDPDTELYFPTLLDVFVAMHAELRDARGRLAALEASLNPETPAGAEADEAAE